MTGTTYGIVPVRGLSEGKSRLSRALTPSERHALNAWFAERMLDTLKAFPGAALTIVATGSRVVKALARDRGMWVVDDPGLGLNRAVAHGLEFALSRGARAAFVVPVDLPFATAETLRGLVGRADSAPVCLIVPDRARQGTNFLLQSPLRLAELSYGEGSFQRHCALAEASGLRVRARDDEACAFDIDSVDDLAQWRRSCGDDPAAFPSFLSAAPAIGGASL